MKLFVLNAQGKPVGINDPYYWAQFMEKNGAIAWETVNGYKVSTAFLGVAHTIQGDDPALFETLVIDATGGIVYNVRYKTLEDAREGHSKALELARTL